jgi:uncharacterized repeat protein (TIGR01451 family)
LIGINRFRKLSKERKRRKKMKKLFTSVVVLLMLVSTFAILPLVKADSSEVTKKLAVPYMYQGDTQWCFLNSLSMVLQYYGVRIHAWDLAETWNLGHDEGTGNILHEIIEQKVKDFVESKGLTVDTPVVGGTWTFDFYRDHIDSAEPVILCGYSTSWQIIPTGGHAVVVVGYKSNSTGDYLLIHDPSGYFVEDEWGDWAEATYPYMYAIAPWNKVLEYFMNLYNLLSMYDIVIHGTPQPPEGNLYIEDDGINHTGPANQGNDGHLYLGNTLAWTNIYLGNIAGGEEILSNEKIVVQPRVANQHGSERKYKVRTVLRNTVSGQDLVSLVKAQTVQGQQIGIPVFTIDLSTIAHIDSGSYDLTISLWGENPNFQTDIPYDVLGPFRLIIASEYAGTNELDVFQDALVIPAGGIHGLSSPWTVDIKASVGAYLHSSNTGWFWSLYTDAYMIGTNAEEYRDTGKTTLEFKVNAYNPSGGQIYAGSWVSTDEDGDDIYGDFSHLGGGTPSIQSQVSSLSNIPEYIVLKMTWRIYDEFWWPVPNVWKESNEVEVARLYRTRSGGPDSFGYTFIDSKAPGGPTYDWIEISGTGTEILPNSDDDWVTNINIGFFFNYYGTDYSQLAIGNNGLLFSGVGTRQYINDPITQSPNIHGFIAPYWDDIVTWGSAVAIYYQTLGTAPNRKFVVEWYNNGHYHDSSEWITFEAILYEGTDNILFQYQDVTFGSVSGAVSGDNPPYDNGGSATVGIEDPTGNIGLQYSFNEQVITPGLAILFKFPAFAGTNMYLSMNAPASMDRGNTMTYTLYYNDFGDVAASNVVLQATLSPNVDFVSASDGGSYDPATRSVTWNIGTVPAFPSGRGSRTITATIPASVPVGTVIQNTASISTSTLETRYDDNTASAQTTVTGSNLPPNVGVGPTVGTVGGMPSVYWRTPITFTYYSPTATGVDIRIHLDDGGPDITGSMTGGPPTWTFTTTFYPRTGRSTVTYTVLGTAGPIPPLPSTIRVLRTASGQIEVVDFKDYVKNVLPNEWISSWDMDALKAGAMSVKTYAWYWTIHQKYPGQNYDVKDSTADQVYIPGTSNPRTDQAVEETWNWVMTKDGEIFQAQYDSGTAGSPEPLNPSRMSQWGTQYWAERDKDWQWIVHYYYDPIEGPLVPSVSFDIYVDPAGYVYDVNTGERISGATVWLQRPDGHGDWENVPTGQTPPIMQPDLNPQITGPDGQYQWDVLEGTYRVHVEATGYYPADSIVVTVPPPVTDLHIGLTPLPPPADSIPPTTTLTIGNPKYIDPSGNIYVTSATPFILSAEDNVDGSGVATTGYRIHNTTYDSGWIALPPPIEFYLTGLADGEYFIEYNSTDNIGNVETPQTQEVTLDNTPPTTTLNIGEPKYVDPTGNIYVSSVTPFTLTAEDNAGGTGVTSTFYRIYNSTYDSDWVEYSAPFYLTGLSDGEYSIDYYSTDNIGNTEPTNTATVILDNTPPTTTLTIGEPKYISDTTYVTPDTLFTLEATDTESGVHSTAYRIYNTTYNSGWLTYTVPFYLTSLTDGAYTIEYNSTDNAQNIEATHAINVTLFSWNYIYQDTYGRGTILKINLAHKFFQFIRPNKDYGIRKATYMHQCGRAIIISHCDKELRLNTVSVDTKLDFCYAMAWDLQTRKCYLLIDKAGIET